MFLIVYKNREKFERFMVGVPGRGGEDSGTVVKGI